MTSPPSLRLGTRRSPLALAQSTLVADALASAGVTVHVVEIVTEGDSSSAPLTEIGGTGVFATALRRALLGGDIDLAVHSLKDLPVTPAPGLRLAAISHREDPRDVLVARDGLTIHELPAGSVVGTGSPRREAQIRALGLDLVVEPVRGNVDTRIGLVDSARCDAVVLARAGLSRLGRLDRVTQTLDPIIMLPAPGQGALALECRSADADTATVLARLDDADARTCVTAERSLLATLEAGCSAPVGALAELVEGEDGLELSLRAFVGAVGPHDRGTELRRSMTGPADAPQALGAALAHLILEDLADQQVPV